MSRRSSSTVRRKLPGLRHRLTVSTILMSGMIVVLPQARAANLPGTPTVAAGTPTFTLDGSNVGAAGVDGTGTSLDVGLNNASTIINWGGGFNVGTGKTVNFSNGSGAAAAVLNRDTSGTGSSITGTLTSAADVSVYILNTNGITFGAGANVNVGALIASSLPISNADFTAGTLHFTDGTGATTAGISMSGGTITTTNELVFLGATVNQSAGTISAGTDAAFVAGTDITVTAGAGSPLAFQIDRGTTVTGAVTASGTVGGQNVTLGFASQDAVTGAVLTANGTITATTVTATDRGIVLSAGATTSGVTIGGTDTNGQAAISAGALTATGTYGSITAAAHNELTTGTLSAVRNVSLTSSGLLTTGSVTAINGGITLAGTGDTDVTGAISATNAAAGDLSIDRSGALSVTSIAAGRDVLIGQTTMSASVTTTGTMSAGRTISVTSSGAQSYGAGISLGAASDFTSTGGSLGFSAIDGGAALTTSSSAGTTFGGVVGGTTALTSLGATAGGGITISGGAITTTAAQSYNSATVLGANATLAGVGISFANTLNGAYGLTVNNSGITTFSGAVGGTTALASLTTNAGGSTRIGGGAVTTTGAQTYNDAVVLQAATTLASTGSGNLTLGAGTSGAFALTANTQGGTRIAGATGLASITTDAGGTSTLSGTIGASGAQTYNDAVTLAAATTVSSSGGGTLNFVSTIDGGFSLSTSTTGTKTFGGVVGGTTALASLNANGGSGVVHIDGGAITVTGTLDISTTATVLGADATLAGNAVAVSTTNGAFALTVNAATTQFVGVVGGTTALSSITTNAAGTTTINTSAITTTGAQTYNDNVALAANTTLTSTGSGAIGFGGTINGGRTLAVNTGGTTSFGGAVGGTTALTSLTTDAGGGTSIGGNVRTTGAQTYGDAITLTGNAALTSTGNSDFAFTTAIDGGFGLTVNTTGATSFGAVVGGTTALASITTNSGGTTAINGGAITTTGAQSYGDAVTIGAATTLTGAGLSFTNTLDGGFALSLVDSGATVLGGAVGGTTALASLTTDAGGSTAINGGAVTTTGAQSYGDAVTIGAAATLASSGNAAIGFAGTVNGGFGLTVNTGGATGFGGAVGGTTALASLTTDAGGTTSLAGNVTTSGAQSYGDAVTLSGNATLASSGNAAIGFGSTVDGGFGLTVNTGGATSFGGAVGGTTALASLTTNAGGSTAINGGAVTTTGAQSYADAVTLGANTTLASTGSGALSLGGGTSGAFTLALNTQGNSSITGATGLSSITTDAGGTTTLGGTISTSGAQSYAEAITLASATTLISTGNSDFAFTTTIDGGFGLTVNTTGATTFGAAVGGTTALASLTTDAGGSTAINGGSIRTTGSQSYNDAVTLGAATTLTGAGLSFASTLDGAFALSLVDSGTTTLGGAVGGTTALASLTTNSGGTTAINGGAVTTSGAQTYADAVTLGANTTLASTGSGALSLGGGTSGAFTLALNTQGNSSLTGATGLASITTDAGGTTTLGGTISTTGAQSYAEAITLASATTLTSTGNSDFAFTTAIDGGFGLSVNTTGATTFGAAVGGTTALASLTTNTGGTTAINGGAITTTGAQSYGDAVTIGAATTLTGAGLSFTNTLDGGFALSLVDSGATVLGGAVGGTTALASLTTDAGGSTAINGGAVTTTGAQSYGDAVTIGAAATLASSGNAAIGFAGTVNGGFGLTVNTGGATSFGGALGGTTALASLTTDAGGTTSLAGNVTTSGAQSYGDAVTLSGNATLASSGNAAIGFGSTVDGGFGLTVNTGGATSFGGAVGGTTALASLTTNAGGSTAINGGAVTTTGAQSYNDAVTLGAATTLTGAGIGFAGTLDGAFGLTLTDSGNTTIGGAVGGTAALASLVTNAGGSTLVGASVTTTGAQSYGDAVVVTANTTLTSTGDAAISFAGSVNANSISARALTITTAGDTIFNGAVGDTLAVSALTLNGGGTTRINGGSLRTFGTLTAGSEAILLGADAAIGGTNVALSTIDGAFAATVTAAGGAQLGGAIGGATALTSFTTVGAAVATINGGTITTTGGQTYNSSILLGAATTLASTGGGDVVFNSTLNGGQALTVNTAGTTRFVMGAGASQALASLTTDAGGGTAIAGNITTTGAQSYGDAITLIGNAGLFSNAGANFNFTTAIDGGFALGVSTSGTVTFGAPVGATTALASLTSGGQTIFTGGTITTTGNQTYNGSATLGAATTLTGADLSFLFGTLDGAFDLTLTGSGTTSFAGGAVGGTAALASLTTNGGGITSFSGGSVTTSGLLNYADAVEFRTDTTLASTGGGAVTFGNTVNSGNNGNFALTVNTVGATTFGGPVGGARTLTALTTNAGGTTAINGGAVTTTATQSYGDAVTIGAATTLTGVGLGFAGTLDGGFALSLVDSGTTTLGGAVGATTALASLTTNAGGTTAINGGSVRTSGAQAYNDAVTLGAATTLTGVGLSLASTIDGAFALTLNDSGATTLGGRIGGTTALASLTTNAGGTTSIASGRITTTGAQSYGDAVLLAGDLFESTGGGAIGFASTIEGPGSLIVYTTGATSFGGAIGGTTALSSVETDAGGTTAINGGLVRTTGAQTYGDAVTIGADTVITGFGNSFRGTVDGGFALTVNDNDVTEFRGAIGGTTALASLTTTALGETHLGGTIRTTGAQTYGDAISFSGATTFTGANISFTQSLNGNNALTINDSGTTIFGGTVDGNAAITSITTDAGGTTVINGFRASASGALNFGDAVVIGANTRLTGASIAFASTVDGGFGLTLESAGATSFGGAVGGITALASLTTDVAGITMINGGSVRTTGAQSYGEAVTIGAATILTGSDVGFAATLNGAFGLTVNASGATMFGGAVGGTTALASLATDAGGSTAINGGSVRTTGAQSYGDAATIGAATVLTSTGNAAIGFAGTLDGGFGLTVNTTGATVFGGAVGGTTALEAVTTNAGGTTAINGGAVRTVGAQSYGDAVTIGADTILRATGTAVSFASTLDGGHALTINASQATLFNGAVGGITALASLTTDSGGTTTISGGSVRTTGAQSYGDATTLGAATTLTGVGIGFGGILNGAQTLSIVDSGTTSFGGNIGLIAPLTSLTTDAGGTTAIGASIITSGNQSYGDAVRLTTNVTLTSQSGTLDLASTVDGAFRLTLNAATKTLGGAVGGTTALEALDAGNGTIFVNGGSVITSGTQEYRNSAVVLGANASLTGGSVFLGGVDGAFGLTIHADRAVLGSMGRTTALASLDVTSTLSTSIDDSMISGALIRTTGAQAYNGPVVLGSAATLTSTGAGAINFASTIIGNDALRVNTAGATIFGGAIGASNQQLSLLSTDSAGTTAINGGLVSASSQSYGDAVTIGADTVLIASSVQFGGTLNGGFALNANGVDGTTRFDGAVGNLTALTSYTASKTALINGGLFSTTGAQVYGDGVTIGANTILNGHDISVAHRLEGNFDLTVNDSGATVFGRGVSLASLTTTAGGSTAINGGSVDTTGVQIYGDAVTIAALQNDPMAPPPAPLTIATLTSSGGGAISFASTVDGNFGLAVNTSGATSFGGAVGGTIALTSLTTNAGGTTLINGGLVSTTGAQSYGDAVTIGAATTLNGANIGFSTTLNGGFALAVNDSATTSFGGAVGGTTALASLTTNAGGSTAINGGLVTTSGAQSYGDAVTIGANTALNGTNIGFANTLNGGFGLAVNASGATVFGGAVGGTTALASLATDTAGTTAIIGGLVTTTGAQAYGDAVTIGANTVLNGTDIGFATTLNGGFALAVNGSGATVFGGAVGGATALASLATDAAGRTAINGGSVSTSGAQSFNDVVTLGATTALNGGAIGFATTLDGAFGLTANSAGATVFGGAVGGTIALASLTTNAGGTTAINGGLVTTSGAQSYGDAVTIGANTALNGAGVGFASTVDGGFGLSLTSSGAAVFSGAVGGATALASLTVNATGTTQINGALVTTTGGQIYRRAVTIGANSLLSGSAVGFASTVDGGFGLTVNSGGATIFGGVVGGTTALTSLTTNAGGTVAVAANVTTNGAQSYGDAFTLTGNAILASSGNAVIGFGNSVDGAFALTVNTGGTTAFAGAIGGTTALASLTTSAGGTTLINGGRVSTSGAQAYGDAVRIGAATTLTGANIGFASTLDGAFALAINDSGATLFGGAVGATTALASLTTNSGGSTAINGGSVTTTASQSYGDAVTIGTATVLRGTDIGFATTLDGTQTLTVSGGGLTSFGGAVGATAALASLTLDGGGTTSIGGGSIRTTGTQSYTEAVSFTGATSFAGGDIGFTTIDGNAAATLTGGAIAGTSLRATSAAIGATGGVTLSTLTTTTGDATVAAGGGAIGITTIAAAGNATLTGGTIALAGNVTVGGDYSVTGTTIALGNDADTETHSAGGKVTLKATGGTIVGGVGLTLVSNSGGVADANFARALNLDATGSILFDTSSTINAGPARQSVIGIGLRSGGTTLALGTVSAAAIRSVNGDYSAYVAPIATSGEISLVTLTTTDAIGLATSAGSIRGNGFTSTAGGIALTASGAVSGLEANRTAISATATGQAVTIAAGGALFAGPITAGGALAVSAASADVTTATAGGALTFGTTGGNILLGTGTAGIAAVIDAATTATIGTLGAGTTLAVTTRGGALALTSATAGGNATLDASTSATIGTIGSGAALSITTRSGTLALTTGTASGAAAIDVATSANIGTLTSGTTLAVTTRGGALALTSATAGGAATLDASTSATIGTIGSGAALAVTTRSGALTLTTGTAGGAATIDAATSADIGTATAGAALAVTTRGGNLVFGQGGGATTTSFTVAQKAFLTGAGTVYAGGTSPTAANALTLTARDADLNGAVRAGAVTIVNSSPTNVLRLGDGLTGSAGFDLTTTEINRIATASLALNAQGRDVAMGTIPLAATTGSSFFGVLGTGRIDITGTLTATPAGRTIQLGGSRANTTDKASFIRIAATVDGGGRLYVDNAALDLRGVRIAVGQDTGFISTVAGQSTADVVTNFVAQPNSTLYNAQALGAGGLYTAPDLIRTATLSVRFTDYALFQNTGISGQTTGVVINSDARPTLSVSGSGSGAANAAALFGTINGRDGNSAALLGPDVIATNDLNLNNSRINGCLVGSGGGGCLISSIATPQIQVFDPNQINLFRSADDLALAFDPVVGGNNESLFSDIGTIEFLTDDEPEKGECDPNKGGGCAAKDKDGANR